MVCKNNILEPVRSGSAHLYSYYYEYNDWVDLCVNGPKSTGILGPLLNFVRFPTPTGVGKMTLHIYFPTTKTE